MSDVTDHSFRVISKIIEETREGNSTDNCKRLLELPITDAYNHAGNMFFYALRVVRKQGDELARLRKMEELVLAYRYSHLQCSCDICKAADAVLPAE